MSDNIRIIQADINDARQLHETEVLSFPSEKAASIEAFVTAAKNAGKKHISLTCKEALIGFYESFGYTERGISDYSNPTI